MEKEKKVKLPPRKVFKTPRPLLADAYTVGSNAFQSEKAKEKSVYYIVFRRSLYDFNPDLYTKGDDRIVFAGLSRILEKIFYEPITHEEIDESINFLRSFKVTTKGMESYHFPEEIWRRVVDEFNGRPPIKVEAFPEGSVVYPNEPVVQISSEEEGMGELAAWFESVLLHVWAASERVTQNQHWFNWLKHEVVLKVNPDYTNEEANFFASLMLHDFGARAGITMEETEELGLYHLLTFPGTDSCAGAYQAWAMSGEMQFGSSVYALAHRNVQAFEKEEDCYKKLYESSNDGDITSHVADCYDFKNAVSTYLLEHAKHASETKNGKIVVGRPDSGDAKEQVIWICKLAKKHGLSEELKISKSDLVWTAMTTLKFLEGDGMTFKYMKEIIIALMEEKFAPHLCGLFGVGGGLRNGLKRDNLSAKYALSSMGLDDQGVVKFSEVAGKSTLPGPFKVLRTEKALKNKCTVVFDKEEGESALKVYFDGSNIWEPFGEAYSEVFPQWKARIEENFESMPLNLERGEQRFPASEAVLNKRLALLEKYAPNKIKDRS